MHTTTDMQALHMSLISIWELALERRLFILEQVKCYLSYGNPDILLYNASILPRLPLATEMNVLERQQAQLTEMCNGVWKLNSGTNLDL